MIEVQEERRNRGKILELAKRSEKKINYCGWEIKRKRGEDEKR